MTTENTGLISEASAADVLALLESNSNANANDKALATVTSGGFLPYIQLYGSNSKEVKRGKFPMGNFGLTENKVTIDLGKSFVAMILAWRPKAMQFKPDVLSFYDPKSQGFMDIQRTADGQDSGKGYGPELLFWLPEQKKFATYFFGNKTGRNEAPNVIGEMKKSRKCKIVSDLIENKKFSWHGPKCEAYDLTLNVQPDITELKAVLEKFNNPPSSTVELAEKDGADERG